MKKNILLVCIGVFVIGVISLSIIKNGAAIPENNAFNKPVESTTEREITDTADQQVDTIKDIPQSKDKTQTVDGFGVTYTVNSVSRSKERGSLDMIGDRYDGIQVDSAGTLQGDQSYLTINVTIQNDLDQSNTISLGNNRVLVISDQGELIEEKEFLVYDQGQDIWAKDYGLVELQPKETVTYNVGYLLDDDTLDQYSGKDQLWYKIDPVASMNTNQENKALIPLGY